MRKNTPSFEPYLEIYTLTRTPKAMLYRLAHAQPSESFLKQWVQREKAVFQASAESGAKTTSGTLAGISNTGGQIAAPAGNTAYGIVVGTGNAAVAIDDYKLGTQILHGSGAGQLDHKAVTFDAFQVVGSVASFRSKRQFENLSGSTITITESGLYVWFNGTYYFCTLRDLLTTPFNILNTQIAEFRYTFKATI